MGQPVRTDTVNEEWRRKFALCNTIYERTYTTLHDYCDIAVAVCYCENSPSLANRLEDQQGQLLNLAPDLAETKPYRSVYLPSLQR